MAAGKAATSFDDIIRAGRQKKKNEELASRILGKNRRASAPGSGAAGKKAQNATPGSLASRIGVTKRSASTSSKPKPKPKSNKPAVSAAPPASSKAPRSKPANKRRPDEDRLISALNPANGQSTIRDNSGGMSIKGASSGPFVVIGSNFAPGTTAADIQSALEPVCGSVMNCWITSQYPTVTAEITFAEKWSAENTVANFHNQKADGRILSMRWKPAGAASDYNTQASFDNLREQADRQRRNRRADPAIQDGTYGFQDNRLYSDQMMVDAPTQPLGRRYR
ncbi:hypothetical protein SI65_08121 [Aspergillus cristatus]|uniref:RRM domain-containing protein n=1 Tax=Aspergillus cristatus TaxID=573508 RepID=A0A1E3B6R0_ASPCR|nr:hypothetical protein SI65_08121 [Aspergillus cristatus]